MEARYLGTAEVSRKSDKLVLPPGEVGPTAELATAPPGEVKPPRASSGILFVGKCRIRETGNATTLARLCRYVESWGWVGVTRDLDDLVDLGTLRSLVKSHSIAAVVGLHAYRSAHVLSMCEELGMPYAVVFGGTDMNECSKEAAKLRIMTPVVLGAKERVVFDAAMRDLVLATWPSLDSGMMSILPQAVVVDPCPKFDVLGYLKSLDDAHEKNRLLYSDNKPGLPYSSDNNVDIKDDSDKCYPYSSKDWTSVRENDPFKENARFCDEAHGGLSQKCAKSVAAPGYLPDIWLQERSLCEEVQELPTTFQPLVLLVAGLRPVKDVLFVAEAWSSWHQNRSGRGRMVIMGPSLDPCYAAHVRERSARMSGVRVAPSLPPQECQAVIKSATVLVNSSLSESMPSSMLEAMMLGTPLLARDIPGIASLVTQGVTGLLYSCPATFLQGLHSLLHCPNLKNSLVVAARDRVTRHHSPRREQEALLKILHRVVQQQDPCGT